MDAAGQTNLQPKQRRAEADRSSSGRRTSGGRQSKKSRDSEAFEPTTEAPANGSATPTERHNAKPRLASTGVATDEAAIELPEDLSFQQARIALDLMIAELQSSDLEVEEMLNLYRRAEAYAGHCEAVLQQVDQDVIEWDVLQESRESQG